VKNDAVNDVSGSCELDTESWKLDAESWKLNTECQKLGGQTDLGAKSQQMPAKSSQVGSVCPHTYIYFLGSSSCHAAFC